MTGINLRRICALAPILLALHTFGQSRAHGLPLPNDTAYVQSIIEYAFTIPKGETLPPRMDRTAANRAEQNLHPAHSHVNHAIRQIPH